MPYPLVSLTEVRAFIKTGTSYTANDAQYQDLALKASKLISQYTRRDFELQEYTEYFGTRKAGRVSLDLYGNATGGYSEINETQSWNLSNTPIDLEEDFNVYFDLNREWAEESLITPTRYWVDAKSGRLTMPTFVGKTEHTLKVVYSAGYEVVESGSEDVIDAPEDLKLACLVTVANLFSKAQDRLWGFKQAGSDDHAQDYAHYGMIPPEAREILLPYRKVFMGKSS